MVQERTSFDACGEVCKPEIFPGVVWFRRDLHTFNDARSRQPLKMESTSDTNLLITYQIEGNTVIMTRPTGQSYRALLDGTDGFYEGDPNVIAVSVKRIDANTIEETYRFNGKAASVARVSVSADGKSMTITVKDSDAGTTTSLTASKQWR